MPALCLHRGDRGREYEWTPLGMNPSAAYKREVRMDPRLSLYSEAQKL